MTLAFFRRHRKWFMVLMAAAVVSMMFFQAWSYMGPRISQWLSGNAGGPVMGTMQDKPVHSQEVQDFYTRMLVAGRFSETLLAILRQGANSPESRMAVYRVTVGTSVWTWARPAFVAPDEKLQTRNILAWLALYKEAQAAGFDTSEAQVNERLAAVQAMGMPVEILNRFIYNIVGDQKGLLIEGLRIDMTTRAYVDWLGETMSDAVTPQLRKEFVKNDDRLQIRMAVFKATDFLPEVKTVPEEDLVKQFDAYKIDFPGKGKEGYGYRISDKVALEYLVADPKAFEEQAAAKVTDDQIKAYYEAVKDRDFLVEPPAVTSTAAKGAAATGTSAATATAPAVTSTAPAATATAPAATATAPAPTATAPAKTATATAPTATAPAKTATATAATATAPAPTATASAATATTPAAPAVTATPAATVTAPAATPTAAAKDEKVSPKSTASAGPRGDAGVTGATVPAVTRTAAATPTTAPVPPAITPTVATTPTAAPVPPAITPTAATTPTAAPVPPAITPTAAATPTAAPVITRTAAPVVTRTAAPVITRTAAPGITPTAVPAPTSTLPLGALLPQIKKYKPFSEVKDEIRKTLVHEVATRMAYELLRGDVAEIGRLQKPSLGIWADGKRVRWVTLPGFRTEEQLTKETDVGRAVRLDSQGSEPETLASDAFSIKELKVEKPKLAVGEISDPYLGKDGQVFAFRVTAVLPNHPPESLAEVRDAVLVDVKGIKALDLARQKAKALLEEAEKKGLEAAAKDLGVKTVESAWFAQQIIIPVPFGGRLWTQPPDLPEIGPNATVVDECFRMAAETKKYSQVTLADQQLSLVIELEGHKAPRLAVFEQQRAALAQDVAMAIASAGLQKVISLEDVLVRNKVEVLKDFEEFRPTRGQKQTQQNDDGF